MDYAQYVKKRRDNKPHSSYFNAYIDGKTNGIASNGLQMGHSQTAYRTGVIREGNKDYLDEPGDIRDVLKADLMESLKVNGFTGHMEEFATELNAVAETVFSHRDLNKKTTMTFGYGKEIASFKSDMGDTIALLAADPNLIQDPDPQREAAMREAFIAALPTVQQNIEPEVLNETLMSFYGPALEGVMSPEALATRSIMRSAAVMHAATNTLLSIKTATGMDMNFGRNVQEDYTEADLTKYRLRGTEVREGAQEFTAAHRTTKPTSAAARTRDETTQPGEYAYGGIVVGPVQSLDAATVALSAAGKSWDRM